MIRPINTIPPNVRGIQTELFVGSLTSVWVNRSIKGKSGLYAKILKIKNKIATIELSVNKNIISGRKDRLTTIAKKRDNNT